MSELKNKVVRKNSASENYIRMELWCSISFRPSALSQSKKKRVDAHFEVPVLIFATSKLSGLCARINSKNESK